MLFADERHKRFYDENITKTKSEKDSYRQALFYTLGLTDETRRFINDLYDFEEEGINFEGLNKPWQTSTTMRITRLAFNLYNNFHGKTGDEIIDNPENYTPENIFCDVLMGYFFEAVKIRYPEYYKNYYTGTEIVG